MNVKLLTKEIFEGAINFVEQDSGKKDWIGKVRISGQHRRYYVWLLIICHPQRRFKNDDYSYDSFLKAMAELHNEVKTSFKNKRTVS